MIEANGKFCRIKERDQDQFSETSQEVPGLLLAAFTPLMRRLVHGLQKASMYT